MKLKKISNSLTTVEIGKYTIWFSYETIVAFRDETGLHCSENQWSVTTGKHLNEIEPDKSKRLDAAFFNEYVSKLDSLLRK